MDDESQIFCAKSNIETHTILSDPHRLQYTNNWLAITSSTYINYLVTSHHYLVTTSAHTHVYHYLLFESRIKSCL